MAILTGLQPSGVFEMFEQLCGIPHGSRNTKAISDFCVRFAQEHGLDYRQGEFIPARHEQAEQDAQHQSDKDGQGDVQGFFLFHRDPPYKIKTPVFQTEDGRHCPWYHFSSLPKGNLLADAWQHPPL